MTIKYRFNYTEEQKYNILPRKDPDNDQRENWLWSLKCLAWFSNACESKRGLTYLAVNDFTYDDLFVPAYAYITNIYDN